MGRVYLLNRAAQTARRGNAMDGIIQFILDFLRHGIL
jgi:hypothetical protein